ncbi:MAG: hypothetical protein AABX38_05955 [Candidatus Micrarchaeota archaeon]
MNPISRERVIIEASARVLTSRYHKDLPFEKAVNLVERNRALDKPALYAGANKNIADFLATGCKMGVFVDPMYSQTRPSSGQTNLQLFLENFRSSLSMIEGATNPTIKEEGNIKKRSGKWIMRFYFHKEERTVACYGSSITSLGVMSEPPELESGVTHYTTVHFPSEWRESFTHPHLLSLVVPGGHLETWHPHTVQPMLDLYKFELLHRNGSNDQIKAMHGELTVNGVSLYNTLFEYAIFRKNA